MVVEVDNDYMLVKEEGFKIRAVADKKYMIDKSKNLLVVKKNSLIDKHLRFDGKIVVGINTSLWGNVEGTEIYFGKGCYIGGTIKGEKVVIGSSTEFGNIQSEGDVLIQDGSKGNSVVAAGDVKVRGGSFLSSIESEGHVTIEGDSKIDKVSARKVHVVKD